MPTVQTSEADLAVLLSALPAFEQWRNQPLTAGAQRMLREADDQQLMTIAVEALHRIIARGAG